MAVDLPEGFDDELTARLERDIGGSWADVFAQKWGTDWAAPCAQDLERQLGSGWASESTDSKAAALVALVGASAASTAGGEEDSFPDPAQDAWIQTAAGVSSFEEWLVRIGAPADEAAALIRLAESEGTSSDTAQSE